MKTILLIDDDMCIRKALRGLLESKNIEVFTAENGRKGIKTYKDNRPDCVFLDGNLPDINGEEVFKRIKRIDSHVDIYFLTGDDSFEKKAQELGAKGYLPKPINITKILNIISTN